MHYKRRSRRLDKRRWASCGCCFIITPGKEPIEDGPCNGYVRSKKPSKPKERCSANRVHEWYREEVVGTDYWSDREFRYKRKTCIHCWLVKDQRIMI